VGLLEAKKLIVFRMDAVKMSRLFSVILGISFGDDYESNFKVGLVRKNIL